MQRVGAIMVVIPIRLLCLLGAILVGSSSRAQEQQELPREAKQLNSQPEQKYDLELSFPVDSVLATNVNDDRRARIDNLIQEILLATQVKNLTDCFIFSHKIRLHFLEIFSPKERLKGGEVSSGTGAFVSYQGLRGVMGPLCKILRGSRGHHGHLQTSCLRTERLKVVWSP